MSASRLDDLVELRDRLDCSKPKQAALHARVELEIERECLTLKRRQALRMQIVVPEPVSPETLQAAEGVSAAVIRDWARRTGHPVRDSGRVPAEIRLAYAEALERGELDDDPLAPVTPRLAEHHRRQLLAALSKGTGAVDDVTGEYLGRAAV